MLMRSFAAFHIFKDDMCEHDAADAYKISDGNDDDDDYMTVGQIPEIGKQGGLLASDMQSNGQEPRIILSVMDD